MRLLDGYTGRNVLFNTLVVIVVIVGLDAIFTLVDELDQLKGEYGMLGQHHPPYRQTGRTHHRQFAVGRHSTQCRQTTDQTGHRHVLIGPARQTQPHKLQCFKHAVFAFELIQFGFTSHC